YGGFMIRTDYDLDGRPTANYVPRYDGAAYSNQALGSSTQTTQCPTGVTPQTVAGLPAAYQAYPSGVGVCATRVSYFPSGNRQQLRMPTSDGTDNRYVSYNYTEDNLVLSVDAPSPAGGRTTPARYVYDGRGKA